MRIRYFVINANTNVVHIHGLCQHTKPRNIPIRLFDTVEEAVQYTGRTIHLCKACEKELNIYKKETRIF